MTQTPTDPTFEPDIYAPAAAALLGLSIDPAWMPAIVMNLRVLRDAADRVGSVPLPDEAEAAPVFTA